MPELITILDRYYTTLKEVRETSREKKRQREAAFYDFEVVCHQRRHERTRTCKRTRTQTRTQASSSGDSADPDGDPDRHTPNGKRVIEYLIIVKKFSYSQRRNNAQIQGGVRSLAEYYPFR